MKGGWLWLLARFAATDRSVWIRLVHDPAHCVYPKGNCVVDLICSMAKLELMSVIPDS